MKHPVTSLTRKEDMRKSLRTLQVLAVTAIAAAGLGVVASPAYAATCTTGNLCMWNGQYETGTKRTMTLSPGNCVNLSSPWDNRIRSSGTSLRRATTRLRTTTAPSRRPP